MALTLRRSTYRGEASPHGGEDCEMYEVEGLQAGVEIFIRRTNGTWKVMRVRNGVRQSWAEGFDSLEQAFATVLDDDHTGGSRQP